MYEYTAIVRKIVDGDTVIFDIDVGFRIWLKKQRVRLKGIDAPNLRDDKEAWQKAKVALENKLLRDTKVILRTTKDRNDMYGRYLAEVFLDTGEDINAWLLKEGHAIVYKKEKRG